MLAEQSPHRFGDIGIGMQHGGGAGYIVSPLILILLPSQATIVGMLAIPATIGEFWVIGYLLSRAELKVNTV